VAEEVRRGILTKEQAKNYSLRHVITKAIGTASDIECDCKVEKILTGDIFLLCSDGLSGMLDDPEILDLINNPPIPPLVKGDEGGFLENRCEKLIKRANEKGGDDNITAILVRYT
jgi:protein phosphatase